MSKQLESLTPELISFIENQHIFFVGTAAEEGRVNVSPKGSDTFRIIDKNKALWLNLTGSGNETAAHIIKQNRITIMFCAFEGKPLILRLYGKAKIYHTYDAEFKKHIKLFPETPGSRQIFEVEIDLVQTSCGYSIPFMDYKEERTTLNNWAKKQGEENIQKYWANKNTESIDGFKTNILGKKNS